MRIHSPYPASWALAQRIGYLYSEGEIIYLADTPFERLLIFNVRLPVPDHDQLVTG